MPIFKIDSNNRNKTHRNIFLFLNSIPWRLYPFDVAVCRRRRHHHCLCRRLDRRHHGIVIVFVVVISIVNTVNMVIRNGNKYINDQVILIYLGYFSIAINHSHDWSLAIIVSRRLKVELLQHLNYFHIDVWDFAINGSGSLWHSGYACCFMHWIMIRLHGIALLTCLNGQLSDHQEYAFIVRWKTNIFTDLHSWKLSLLWGSTYVCDSRADSRLAPSQWETSLQSNAVSQWLGVNLESALWYYPGTNETTLSNLTKPPESTKY